MIHSFRLFMKSQGQFILDNLLQDLYFVGLCSCVSIFILHLLLVKLLKVPYIYFIAFTVSTSTVFGLLVLTSHYYSYEQNLYIFFFLLALYGYVYAIYRVIRA